MVKKFKSFVEQKDVFEVVVEPTGASTAYEQIQVTADTIIIGYVESIDTTTAEVVNIIIDYDPTIEHESNETYTGEILLVNL